MIISARGIIDLYYQHDFCLEQSKLLRRPVFYVLNNHFCNYTIYTYLLVIDRIISLCLDLL